MARHEGVEVLFVEPSGIVAPSELRNAVRVTSRGSIVIEPGPVVLLLNGEFPEAPFVEGVGQITELQIAESDLIVITKLDRATAEGTAALEERVRALAPDTPLLKVSFSSGEGTAELLASVT
jgi:Putative GTPases (G3E family)